MVTATLVEKEIEIGRKILAALTDFGIPVSLCLWAFVPQLGEGQFVIVTPLVDSRGPMAAYGEIVKALQKAQLYGEIPLGRVFLKSPDDPETESLAKHSKAGPEGWRHLHTTLTGREIQEIYLYGGSIRIMQLDNGRPGAAPSYRVTYFPRAGGGALPSVRKQSLEELRDFLEHKLHIGNDEASRAVAEVQANGDSFVANVQLRMQELKRLGLA
jgi:hypothetical protein